MTDAGRRFGLPPLVERVVVAVAWLFAAVLIALGSAGVAAGIDHAPGTDARRELTWAADQAVEPELAAATAELAELSARVDELGAQARRALNALTIRDFETLRAAIEAGHAVIDDVAVRSTTLRARLAGMEAFEPGGPRLSSATRERHATLLGALEGTADLAGDWARLTAVGAAAGRVSDLLTLHDERIVGAIEVGRQGSFPTALRRIESAAAALREADELRAQLAQSVDVSVLNEWIRRNRAYDDALRTLYEESAASPDRATPELRAAIEAERVAREQLPRSTSNLSVIMAEIGRAGLNQAVVSIEETRGRLARALAGLDR